MSVRSLRYNTIEQHFTKGVTASTDRDALAFLEAAQIYNTNQQRAIVNLVRSLKRVGLWSKMKAIYPFVGGTATSHKWNLKDPRDVDAAFRLTFSGGWTHSADGADPNGTNGYADTYLQPSSHLSQNSTAISVYINEELTVNNTLQVNLASVQTSSGNILSFRTALYHDGKNPLTYYGNVNQTYIDPIADQALYSPAELRGLHTVSRTASNVMRLYKNADFKDEEANVSEGLSNKSFLLAGYNLDNVVQLFAANRTAFTTIGDGLTDNDVTNLYNIVDLYQRRLGRNV